MKSKEGEAKSWTDGFAHALVWWDSIDCAPYRCTPIESMFDMHGLGKGGCSPFHIAFPNYTALLMMRMVIATLAKVVLLL